MHLCHSLNEKTSGSHGIKKPSLKKDESRVKLAFFFFLSTYFWFSILHTILYYVVRTNLVSKTFLQVYWYTNSPYYQLMEFSVSPFFYSSLSLLCTYFSQAFKPILSLSKHTMNDLVPFCQNSKDLSNPRKEPFVNEQELLCTHARGISLLSLVLSVLPA